MLTVIKWVGVGILISDSKIQSKESYQGKRVALHIDRGVSTPKRHNSP